MIACYRINRDCTSSQTPLFFMLNYPQASNAMLLNPSTYLAVTPDFWSRAHSFNSFRMREKSPMIMCLGT